MMLTGPPAGTLRLGFAFGRELWQVLGRQLAGAVAVGVLLALTEGAGLVLLVPLLSVAGLAVYDGATGSIARWTERAFSSAGLQPSLVAVLCAFVAIAAAHALLYRTHLLLAPALEQQFTNALRTRLYAAILHARWSTLVRRRTADLVHAVATEVDRVSASAHQLLTMITGVAVAAVYLAVAARLAPRMTITVVAAGFALLLATRGRTKRSSDTARDLEERSRARFRMAADSIAGVKTARCIGAEDRDVTLFARLSHEVSAAYLRMLTAYADGKLRLDIGAAAAISVLLFLGVRVFGIQGAGLLLLLFVFARVVPRIVSLQDSCQLFVAGLPAFDSVVTLIAACERDAEAPLDERLPRLTAHRAITVSEVTFRYDPNAAPAVRDVSLTIEVGRTTAIVGPSGSGKSTLVDLILGLLEPGAGQIAIDGQALDAAASRRWRRSIAYVPQDGFLLHDSVRANLLWAVPGASDSEIWEALEHAAAREFVEARAEGLDTVVGDRGVQLSGGERQRLVLARALLSRPDVLVLDEATSALDADNERYILDTISRLRGRLTIVLITHRLWAVRDADVIYAMDAGSIVASGTWSQLLEQPAFRRAAELQSGSPAEAR